MVLGNVEETLTTTEIDEETSEEIIKVKEKEMIINLILILILILIWNSFFIKEFII